MVKDFWCADAQVKVWKGKVEGLATTFLEPCNGLFWTGRIYGDMWKDRDRCAVRAVCAVCGVGCGVVVVGCNSDSGCLEATQIPAASPPAPHSPMPPQVCVLLRVRADLPAAPCRLAAVSYLSPPPVAGRPCSLFCGIPSPSPAALLPPLSQPRLYRHCTVCTAVCTALQGRHRALPRLAVGAGGLDGPRAGQVSLHPPQHELRRRPDWQGAGCRAGADGVGDGWTCRGG